MSFTVLQNSITLQNHRALLSPIEGMEAAFKELSKVAYIPGIWLYSPGGPMTETRLRSYIQTALDEKIKGVSYPFMIFDKRTNEIAGSTRYMNIVPEHKRLEIGHTWLAPQFHGSGLNKANKYELLKFAFEELGCNRVEFKTDNRNKKSQNAMLKIGAKAEGILRSHMVLHDGYIRDSIYLSIIKEEWEGLKETVFGEWSGLKTI